MKKLCKILVVLCIAALLCGCVDNAGPGESDPALNADPTESTPAPTEPSSEPTQPPTEPSEPPTEPPTEPTLPDGYISEEEAIAAAAEYFQITDYQADCYLETKYYPSIAGTARFDAYIVTLDDGNYFYKTHVSPMSSGAYMARWTPKNETIFPGGPALPPADLSSEEFQAQHTIHYPAGTDYWPNNWPDNMKTIIVRLAPIHQTAVYNGITIRTADGKPIFQHDGRVYIWENETEYTEIGSCLIIRNNVIEYTLYDGEYELTFDFESSFISVEYKLVSSKFYDTAFNCYTSGTPICRLEITNYDEEKVRFFGITDNGEEELSHEIHR